MKKLHFYLVITILLIAIFSFTIMSTLNAASPFITISGTEFYAGGNKIWMNGANTPWNNWNDFGGSFNADWWSNHFQQLHDNGINSTRIWITCSGEVGINIDDKGYVSGATTAHWNNLDSLFKIAQEKQVYIMATLISFDHFKNTYTTYQKWRNMITNTSNIDSFVENYVTPFTNRYKDNPYLWSIDLCNEPDWVFENAECGQISWNWLQTYFAKAAVAIHENSNVLVTVGIAMIKYNSDTCPGAEGNKVSDSALQAIVNSKLAKVDFYSTHYYDWMEQYWGNIFYQSPTTYGLENTKPNMVGECPAKGTSGHTTTDDYENCYKNGWQGAMAWTSNGVDSNGSISELGPATKAFRDNHYQLVFPSGSTTSAPVSSTISTTTQSSTIVPSTPTTSAPKTTATTTTSIPTTTINASTTPSSNTACSIAYNIQNDWGAGSTVNVTIKNNSTSNINSWSLEWLFPGNQKISNLWCGTFTQTGTSVTVKDSGWNGTIAAKGSTSFGFNITYTGSNTVPTSFALNGKPCTIE